MRRDGGLRRRDGVCQVADDRHRGRQCLRSYRSKTDYFGDTSAQTTILNGLVAQSDALIKTLRPDTFRNYALICMAADGTDHCDHLQFVIGSMGRTGGEQVPVTRTDTSAAYSDIVFTLPDAWASYTLTITNKGTADAHLSDGVISLEGADSAQLRLDTPDLSDDVLAPGQSCTVQVVVQALDNGSDTLDTSGALKIDLPYSQAAVEQAPQAGHQHS